MFGARSVLPFCRLDGRGGSEAREQTLASVVVESVIPVGIRQALGLLRDLQSAAMGGDRIQASIEGLESALEEWRGFGL